MKFLKWFKYFGQRLVSETPKFYKRFIYANLGLLIALGGYLLTVKEKDRPKWLSEEVIKNVAIAVVVAGIMAKSTTANEALSEKSNK